MHTLLGLSTAEPNHCVSGEETKRFLAASVPTRRAEPMQRLVDQCQIEQRYTIAPLAELAQYPSIEARAAAYEREALTLAVRAANGALERSGVSREDVSAVLVASSTGHMVPSLSEHLTAPLGLPPSVLSIPMVGLGCVGAMRAIAVATKLLQDSQSNKSVLVVSVELPSLWLQLAEPSIQDIMAAMAFGDGAAAVVVRPDRGEPGLSVVASHSELWPDSLQARRGWLTTTGLRHSASPVLPEVAKRNVRRSLEDFLRQHALCAEQLAFCAINPSDKQLLGVMAEAVGLDERAVRLPMHVWRNHGNTLATGPLYLLQLLGEEPRESGAQGVLLSIGPGVTCDMLLLEQHA